MSDPASWLAIRPGWKVVAADGSEVGEVNHVTGDEQKDIFNGLAIATTALGKPRYVPAEQIAEIRDGSVRLSLTSAAAEALPEYMEPATVDAAADGGASANAAAAAPPSPHVRPVSIWRRLGLLFDRLRG